MIFATLHHDPSWAMVKLRADQQQSFVQRFPECFMPENGACGRRGCTKVRLDAVDSDTLAQAIALACQETVMNPAAGRPKPQRTARSRRPARER